MPAKIRYPAVLWHHAVHRRHGESLYFWRLGFYPTYDGQAVERGLREVLHDAGVRAAVCYEMFGPHDIILRVWLPSTCGFDEFQDALIERLARVNLNMCDPFQVTRPVRHWLFKHDDTGLVPPTEEALARLDDPYRVARIEAGELATHELEELERVALLASFDRNAETTDPDDPGTKFAVVISGDPRLTTAQHRQFEITLTELLDAAERIEQRSLYSGSGFGHFLAMGMVKHSPLSALKDDLLEPITRQHIHTLYSARTYTHVSGRADYVFIHESLIDVIPREIEGEGLPRGGVERSVVVAVPEQGPIIGSIFAGRFEIRREVGRGGFSVVYEAYDQLEQAIRALKVFDSMGANEQIRREIAYLRKVEDPHVMRVYWADRTPEGRWYLVSEFVDGTALTAYVDGERLDLQVAIRTADELLHALEAIHPNERRIEQLKAGELSSEQFAELQELQDAGFVHRDIKPGNIILTNKGSIKLLDFNIASRAGDPVETRSGTPPYQAPDAGTDVWDVSTDLFAAGVVLYELITGEHPYNGGLPRMDREPRDPREFRSDLSNSLALFLLRACAPDRLGRFQSAQEMRKALTLAKREADVDTRSEPREFGARLRVERERLDLATDGLAGRAGLPRDLVAQIESGVQSPTLTQARALAGALNMSLAKLLGTEDNHR